MPLPQAAPPNAMRSYSLLFAVATLLAACARPTPVLESGVEGRVWIGPMCPVVQTGTECPDAPYQATLDVLDDRGQVVATIESDTEGHYRLPLAPGEYTLTPHAGEARLPWAAPLPFAVTAGRWTRLDVHYVSGIR
ncbi:MAG: carboxypeptidase-like regulatory domain-containing protein [Chloroflexota bacterium]